MNKTIELYKDFKKNYHTLRNNKLCWQKPKEMEPSS